MATPRAAAASAHAGASGATLRRQKLNVIVMVDLRVDEFGMFKHAVAIGVVAAGAVM